jgi:hypothetical protein
MYMFDSKQVFDWLLSRAFRERGLEDNQFAGVDKASLVNKKLQADILLREFDLARKNGEIVPIGWLVTLLGDSLARCNAKMNSVSARAAPLVAVETDAKKCQHIIERLMNDARDELVAPTEQELHDAAVSGDSPATLLRKLQTANNVDSERVG